MNVPRRLGTPLGVLLVAAVIAAGATGLAGPPAGLARAATAPNALITAVPTTVNRGGLVIVSGANFAPKETIVLFFYAAPTVVITATADANGLLPPTGVTVPFSIGAGPRHLDARGTTSKRTAEIVLTILNSTPTITLGVTSVKPGESVTVSGKNFNTRERITLALNGKAFTWSEGTITALSVMAPTGSITPTTTITIVVLAGGGRLRVNPFRAGQTVTLNVTTTTTVLLATGTVGTALSLRTGMQISALGLVDRKSLSYTQVARIRVIK